MKKITEYSTPEEQLDFLLTKGLVINDIPFALSQLRTYGYYNIINSYKEPYLIPGTKTFRPGVTFEQIFSLFTLDHNLRNAIMSSMLDLEEHLRAIAADVISESFGNDHHEYLNWKCYRDRSSSQQRFSLNDILETLWKNSNSGKDPIRYYREKYNAIPPWILFKGTYFSTLINFIRLFKNKEKKKLIAQIYGLADANNVTYDITTLFTDTLFICLEYRNTAAHGGRIYNYIPKYEEKMKILDGFFSLDDIPVELEAQHGISRLLALMDAFEYKKPRDIIDAALSSEINRHLIRYPEDKNIIERAVSITIMPKYNLYISHKGKVFHVNPHCSGMTFSLAVDPDFLQNNNYIPCKKCAKHFYKH